MLRDVFHFFGEWLSSEFISAVPVIVTSRSVGLFMVGVCLCVRELEREKGRESH